MGLFEQEYKQDMTDVAKLYFGYIPPGSMEILDKALDYSMEKRLVNFPAQLENNYKNTMHTTTVQKMVNFIMSKKPIMTSYGTLFEKHENAPNPLGEVVDSFLELRAKYKKKMFEYPKGSAEFEYYNLMQSLEKVNANSMDIPYWNEIGALARKGQVKNVKKLLGDRKALTTINGYKSRNKC